MPRGDNQDRGFRHVSYVNLAAQFTEERDALLSVFNSVFENGIFVNEKALEPLESELAEQCGRVHAVGVNSGTDALVLGLRALGVGPGDEVITPPNSFIASAAAIVAVGAKPVFADVLHDQNIDPAAVEVAITERTKAVMPVHLTGRICNMERITEIAERNGLLIIEDAAQSMGSRFAEQPAGSFGAVGCFSAHPMKNFNAAGDAGFVVTDDEVLAARIKLLRNNGLVDRDTAVEWGVVSRMDVFQSELLRFRLKRLRSIVERRRHNATLYRKFLDGAPVIIPPDRECEFNTYHTFVIQVSRRSDLQNHLKQKGIISAVHYPTPIHLQPAASELGYKEGDFPVAESQSKRILSLPIHQFLDEVDIEYVAGHIKAFYGE